LSKSVALSGTMYAPNAASTLGNSAVGRFSTNSIVRAPVARLAVRSMGSRDALARNAFAGSVIRR